MTTSGSAPSLAGEIRRMSLSKRQMRWRKWRAPRTVELDGFALAVEPEAMDRELVHLLWRGGYEDAERAIVRRVLRPGDRVVEGGGGLGLVSMVMARIVGDDAVTVFEASPAAFARITRNLARNGRNIDVRHAALAAAAGTATFHVHDNVISSSLYAREATRPIAVPAVAVADVIAETDPTVLVLDIEGAEIEVLDAAPLAGVRAVVVEIHPRITGDAALVALYRRMFDAGFVIAHELSFGGRVLTFLRGEGAASGA